MCDDYFGELLDYFDAHDLWKDTALVLTTDHGFLLGGARLVGQEPDAVLQRGRAHPADRPPPGEPPAGGRAAAPALTQTIDLAPTLLDCFGATRAWHDAARSLLPLLERDHAPREVALYGIFGGRLNVTDGRYTYFRYPADLIGQELYEYTLMPTHMNRMFPVEQLLGATLGRAFDFTQGVRPLRIPALRQGERPELNGGFLDTRSMLFDLHDDYAQNRPIAAAERPEVVERLKAAAVKVLALHDVPHGGLRAL